MLDPHSEGIRWFLLTAGGILLARSQDHRKSPIAQNNHFVLSDHVHLAIKHFCDGGIFFQDENARIQGVIKLTKWFDENDVNHIPGHLLWELLLAEVLLSSIIFKIPNQGISF